MSFDEKTMVKVVLALGVLAILYFVFVGFEHQHTTPCSRYVYEAPMYTDYDYEDDAGDAEYDYEDDAGDAEYDYEDDAGDAEYDYEDDAGMEVPEGFLAFDSEDEQIFVDDSNDDGMAYDDRVETFALIENTVGADYGYA